MRKYTLLLLLMFFTATVPFLAQSKMQDLSDYSEANRASAETSNSVDNPTRQALIALEHQLWQAMRRRDIPKLNILVADYAHFVDENNVISKSGFTRYVSNYTPQDYSLTHIKVYMINDSSGIVSYRVRARFSSEGVDLPVSTALVTSVWAKQGGRWQLSHHHVSLMPFTRVDP